MKQEHTHLTNNRSPKPEPHRQALTEVTFTESQSDYIQINEKEQTRLVTLTPRFPEFLKFKALLWETVQILLISNKHWGSYEKSGILWKGRDTPAGHLATSSGFLPPLSASNRPGSLSTLCRVKKSVMPCPHISGSQISLHLFSNLTFPPGLELEICSSRVDGQCFCTAVSLLKAIQAQQLNGWGRASGWV